MWRKIWSFARLVLWGTLLVKCVFYITEDNVQNLNHILMAIIGILYGLELRKFVNLLFDESD